MLRYLNWWRSWTKSKIEGDHPGGKIILKNINKSNWISDQNQERALAPDLKLELFFVSGGSDGSRSLEIRGNGNCIHFTISTTSDQFSPADLELLGLTDAVIFRVHSFKLSSNQRDMIAEALLATKAGHGRSFGGETYFVRFEMDGTLYRD